MVDEDRVITQIKALRNGLMKAHLNQLRIANAIFQLFTLTASRDVTSMRMVETMDVIHGKLNEAFRISEEELRNLLAWTDLRGAMGAT
jgi:hypothetical protein